MKYHAFSALVSVSWAQQVYIIVQGPSRREGCSSTPEPVEPYYYTSSFSFAQTETIRTATPAPNLEPTAYGLPYKSVRHISNYSTTSRGNWYPNAASAPTDNENPYDNAAYSALWDKVNPVNFSRGIYSTTVSPTPILSTELVLPSPLYFGPIDCYKIPKGFILGVAGAAAQVEGAVADEGRSPSAPDAFSELLTAGGIAAGALIGGVITNGYTAAENYYLYKQDIDRLAAMGIKFYSFSISWTRILPFALPSSPVNSNGLEHYDDLINYAITKGVQPVVTLLHMDTPLQFFGENYLEGIGQRPYYGYFNMGYQNETFEEAFVNYGKIIMSHFADRVPIWVTAIEPQTGYHIIKAHARLYHFYHGELHGTGNITMKMAWTPGVPQDPKNETHRAAVQHYNDLLAGTFLNPLVLGQDYRDAFKKTRQDYVALNAEDLAYLNGTMDILSFDGYSAVSVFPAVSDLDICATDNATINRYYPTCVGTTQQRADGWLIGFHTDYLMYATPTYVRTQLNYIWTTYGTPIAITEFGLPMNVDGVLDLPSIRYDVLRSEYYLSYLTEVLKAIWEDGVDVVGVCAWSWVDNWEWGTYSHQFGLQYNNRTTHERTYKRSFFDLVDFVESRRL